MYSFGYTTSYGPGRQADATQQKLPFALYLFALFAVVNSTREIKKLKFDVYRLDFLSDFVKYNLLLLPTLSKTLIIEHSLENAWKSCITVFSCNPPPDYLLDICSDILYNLPNAQQLKIYAIAAPNAAPTKTSIGV